MNRLEEIKAGIELKKTLKSRGLHHGGQQEIDDIEYLLNEVERLKEALKKVYELDGYMFVKDALNEA